MVDTILGDDEVHALYECIITRSLVICQNMSHITTKGRGVRVSLPLYNTTVPVKALEATFAVIMQRALKAAKKEYQCD